MKDFKKFDDRYKFKHPRLDYLGTKDWLRFILILTQDHQNKSKESENNSLYNQPKTILLLFVKPHKSFPIVPIKAYQ